MDKKQQVEDTYLADVNELAQKLTALSNGKPLHTVLDAALNFAGFILAQHIAWKSGGEPTDFQTEVSYAAGCMANATARNLNTLQNPLNKPTQH